jgi:hypothetical protein
MGLGWFVALGWLFISIVAVQQGTSDTVGYLGTLMSLSPGWWAVLIAASFGILAAWSSWGLYEYTPPKRQSVEIGGSYAWMG